MEPFSNISNQDTSFARRMTMTMKCGYCQTRVRNEGSLIYHLNYECLAMTYECCGKAFPHQMALEAHQKGQGCSQNPRKPYFYFKAALKQRSQWVEEMIRSLQCGYCQKDFINFNGLVSHLNQTKHLIYTCCDKLFQHPGSLGSHKRSLGCKVKNPMRFSQFNGVERQTAIWIREMLMTKECGYNCGRRYDSLEDLFTHLENTKHHPVYSCCKKLYPNENALAMHKKGKNCIATKQRHLTFYGLPYQSSEWATEMYENDECGYCERSFVNYQALLNHLNTTQKHDIFTCCGKLFETRSGLANHHHAEMCFM